MKEDQLLSFYLAGLNAVLVIGVTAWLGYLVATADRPLPYIVLGLLWSLWVPLGIWASLMNWRHGHALRRSHDGKR